MGLNQKIGLLKAGVKVIARILLAFLRNARLRMDFCELNVDHVSSVPFRRRPVCLGYHAFFYNFSTGNHPVF